VHSYEKHHVGSNGDVFNRFRHQLRESLGSLKNFFFLKFLKKSLSKRFFLCGKTFEQKVHSYLNKCAESNGDVFNRFRHQLRKLLTSDFPSQNFWKILVKEILSMWENFWTEGALLSKPMCWIEWRCFYSIPTSIKRVVGLRNSACEILKISFLHNSSICGKTHKSKVHSCSKWCVESNDDVPDQFRRQLRKFTISDQRQAKKLSEFFDENLMIDRTSSILFGIRIRRRLLL
jgi:hypothetical protein